MDIYSILLTPSRSIYSGTETGIQDNLYKFDGWFYEQMHANLLVLDTNKIRGFNYYNTNIVADGKDITINGLENDYSAKNILDPENGDSAFDFMK